MGPSKLLVSRNSWVIWSMVLLPPVSEGKGMKPGPPPPQKVEQP